MKRGAATQSRQGLVGAPRYLFLQYERPLGAAIMSTPVFEAVKAARPDARIVVACGPAAYGVLRDNPHVDAIIRTHDPVDNLWRAMWQFLRFVSLRAGRFDCVVTDSSNGRTRIAILACLARARRRVGFTLARRLYDQPLDYDSGLGVLGNNMRLLETLGLACGPCEPKLYFSARDARAATAFLHENGLDGAAPIVCFTTQHSGGYPEKRGWRPERFAALADTLAEGRRCRIVFAGTAAERAAIDGIQSRMRAPSVSAAGALSAAQFAALLAQCDLLVTLDTGSLHVARAVGLPAVVIARPWQPAHEWLPIGMQQFAFVSKPDVVERTRLDPSYDAPATIDEVSVDEVSAAVDAMLRHYPPSPQAREARLRSRSMEAPRAAAGLP